MAKPPRKTFDGACPACGGHLQYFLKQFRLKCPNCGTRLLLSSCDPVPHAKSEIDSYFKDQAWGVFRFRLHPVGTVLCVTCGRTYPRAFSCCPGQMELAISMFGLSAKERGPRTPGRLRKYFKA